METLSREIGRLARRLGERGALQEQHERADPLILERLPDPVLILAGDPTLRRTNAAARARCRATYTPPWCRSTPHLQTATRPWSCCRTAHANASSNACGRTSWPKSA